MHMCLGLGKPVLSAHQLDSTFCLYVKATLMHALPRNTKYLTIDGQVWFYRWLFTDAVEPRRCISWP